MDYTALITYMFVMTITPGPNNIMVTASGSNFGYRATLPHMLGICAGGAIQGLFACFGLGMVFVKYPLLHSVLLWAGLAYMLYLARKLLGTKIKEGKNIGTPVTFKQATLFQFINPKAWVMATTEASVFLPQSGSVFIPAIIIVTIGTLICFPCVSFWALFGKGMKKLLKSEKNRLVFNYIMAGLLVITAIMIVVN